MHVLEDQYANKQTLQSFHVWLEIESMSIKTTKQGAHDVFTAGRGLVQSKTSIGLFSNSD